MSGKIVSLDPGAVERFILEWSRFGGFGTSGVNRPVYTEAWVRAQAQYEAWCREAGLAARVDAVGSVWGVLEGREGGPSIVSGSHCDSQVEGGGYDGALGALAALIALKELSARYGPPRRTLEYVSLCEEEGSRFIGAQFWGSRAITGRIGADDPDSVIGWNGETISDAMRAVGLDPATIAEARRDDIEAFVELHIEQGPILEQVDKPVAIVTAITGMRQYLVELTGEQNHAGALPMDLRRDAMAGFAEIVLACSVLRIAGAGRPSPPSAAASSRRTFRR